MPGMTRGFWRDREPLRGGLLVALARASWVHGDWASIDEDGFWYIHGRSDDTLKVAGKRVGPAEVESAAVAHPAVLEAAAIGVPHEIKGEAIVVLCVLRPGVADDEELRALDRASASPTSSASRSSRRSWRSSRSLPEDALGKGHAPGHPGGLAGPRPGRPLRARRPIDARCDPGGGRRPLPGSTTRILRR